VREDHLQAAAGARHSERYRARSTCDSSEPFGHKCNIDNAQLLQVTCRQRLGLDTLSTTGKVKSATHRRIINTAEPPTIHMKARDRWEHQGSDLKSSLASEGSTAGSHWDSAPQAKWQLLLIQASQTQTHNMQSKLVARKWQNNQGSDLESPRFRVGSPAGSGRDIRCSAQLAK
jgi:hypothetical protein